LNVKRIVIQRILNKIELLGIIEWKKNSRITILRVKALEDSPISKVLTKIGSDEGPAPLLL
jgi:hypothetical protein